jgi:hypothetical protein
MFMFIDAAEVHVAEVLHFLQHGNGEGSQKSICRGWLEVPIEGRMIWVSASRGWC